MNNYTDEIRKRLDAMSEGEIGELAGKLEWGEPCSVWGWQYSTLDGMIYFRITEDYHVMSHDSGDNEFSVLGGDWEDPDCAESLNHAKAAVAIFLALVRRDLPDIDLPYCEGLDCGECKGRGKVVMTCPACGGRRTPNV